MQIHSSGLVMAGFLALALSRPPFVPHDRFSVSLSVLFDKIQQQRHTLEELQERNSRIEVRINALRSRQGEK